MSQLNDFKDVIDIQYLPSNKQIRIMRQNGIIEGKLYLKQYNSDQIVTGRSIGEIKQQLQYEYKELSQLKYENTYNNLQTKQIQYHELINKYSIENDIKYKKLLYDDIISVYYYIQHEQSVIQYIHCIIGEKSYIYLNEQLFDDEDEDQQIDENSIPIYDSQYNICRQFVDLINQPGKITILIGFKQSLKEDISIKTVLNTLKMNPSNICSKKGVKTRDCKMQQITTIIQGIPEFNNIYFIDASVCIFENLPKTDKQQLPDNSIQSFINIIQHNSNKSTNKQETMSQIIQLNQLICQYMQNNGIIQQKLMIQNVLQVPLSYALFETNTVCLQHYLIRQYYQKGYQVLFGSSKFDDQESYKANQIIETVFDEMQYKQLEFIGEGDFFSMYPSIISAFNISPETEQFQPDSQYHQIELDDGQIKYFRKQTEQKGIFPELVDILIKLRKQEHKNDQCYKNLLSDIYGIFGYKQGIFYDTNCAKSICSQGRKLCQTATNVINNRFKDEVVVIARYTDSCYFQSTKSLNPLEQVKLYDKIINEWQSINKEINDTLDVIDVFKFKFETNKFSLISMYSKQKNSIIKLCISYEKLREIIIKNPDNNIYEIYQLASNYTTLDIKGCFKWNQYSAFKYNYIKQFFLNTLLDSKYDKNQIFQQISKKGVQIINQLADKDYLLNNIEDYAINLKYSKTDMKCQYLTKTHKIQQACKIVYYQDNQLQNNLDTSQCIFPMEKITKQNINFVFVNKSVMELLQPIRSFFGQKDELIDMPKKYECELRIESLKYEQSKYNEFETLKVLRLKKRIPYDNIQQIINENTEYSFHEIFYQNENKLFFDIDSKNYVIPYHEIVNCITNCIKKIYPQNDIQLHIVQAIEQKDAQKSSFHVVIDIQAHMKVTEFLAQRMDKILCKSLIQNNEISYEKLKQLKQDKTEVFFDLAIYRKNGSLRLPQCIKINKYQQIEQRQLQIQSNSQFSDFFITDIQQCKYNIKTTLFDSESPLSVNTSYSRITEQEAIDISNILYQKTGISVQYGLRENNYTFKFMKQYKCLVCDKNHNSDNIYIFKKDNVFYLNCWSNQQRQHNIHQAVKLEYQSSILTTENIENPQVAKLKRIFNRIRLDEEFYTQKDIQIVNERYINFNIDYPTNYVISSMGTGKSKTLKKILETFKQDVSILCISFRKTFSIEFAKTYNLVNYMEAKGPLSAQTHPRLILQIDSLPRYNTSYCPHILIVDEIESILEKMPSCHNYGSVLDKFITLFCNSKKVIVMDGLMEQKTIEYLDLIRQTNNSNIIYNTMAIKTDYKYDIYRFIPRNIQYIAKNIYDKVISGKKIYGMITSKTYGFMIMKYLQSKNIKVVFYNGQDDLICQDENNQDIMHSTLKQKHFTDVNTYWKHYDVVIHNSSVTAGISFDFPVFHEQINIFSKGTCSSLSFFQGSHRVRHLIDKQVTTYIEQSDLDTKFTPLQYTKQQYDIDEKYDVEVAIDFSKASQLDNWLQARQGAALKYRTSLLFKYIKSMKYDVHFNDFNLDQTTQLDEIDKSFFVRDNKTVFEQMANTKIISTDSELLDINVNQTILQNIELCKINKVDIKRQKFQLKSLYNVTCNEINQYSPNILKFMQQNSSAQELRNNILKAFGVNHLINHNNEPTNIFYVKELIKQYIPIKNLNINTNNHHHKHYYYYTDFVAQLIDELCTFNINMHYYVSQYNPKINNKNIQLDPVDIALNAIKNKYSGNFKISILQDLHINTFVKPITYFNNILKPFYIRLHLDDNTPVLQYINFNQRIEQLREEIELIEEPSEEEEKNEEILSDSE